MGEETDMLKKYNSIYLSIIMRYKEYIEEHEGLYVTELPKLVTPEDPSVISVAKIISNGIASYSYERDFLDAAQSAYQYVKEKIATVSLPIQFWQKPSEALGNGAGDSFDKAVLLCSLLISLGNVSTKIIMAVSDGERHFLVYSEYNGRLMYIDVENGMSMAQDREELLAKLGINREQELTAYEFNDKMYTNIV